MKEIAGLAGVSAATVSRGLCHYILP
ncbi:MULTISPECIES: LacI family DNA-binding transcriptional regulator [Paenibacillus]